jgi:hypothetical protein
MKTFLTLLALVSFNAFAQESTQLKDGDVSFSKAHAEIISVRLMCPKNPGGFSCMAIGSIIKVKVTLNGCLDTFGGYFSKFNVVNGKGVLSFGAINIANEDSMRVRCIAAPTKVVTITTSYQGKIQLESLEFRGNNLAEL